MPVPVITARNDPGAAAVVSRGRDLCSVPERRFCANDTPGLDSYSHTARSLMKGVLTAVLLIAFTDVTLQLDNALAISSVASRLPSSHRLPVLAGGVFIAAICLLTFTIVGSALVERLTWLKPVAGVVLLGIGFQMILSFFRP